MGFFDRISQGLARSREKFRESMNVLLERGPDLDEDFWDGLEETLILSDVGGPASSDIVENLRDQARRKALPDAYAVLDLLYDTVADTFTPAEKDIFDDEEALVLFVGINGTGKTTTVGKIAKAETDAGRKVILGSADTFRAAAIEQLEVWAKRADVEMVTRERGSDPASVCYDTIERAEAIGADLVLIDTAGRLHTSNDLMRELEKVVHVVKKRSGYPVYSVLVIDATTGQNGLQQAREFNRALDLDGLIVTKLDGTAKGGIALAVSHDLGLPIYKIGVGEGIEDLRPFDAHDFARALLGDFDERSREEDDTSEEDFEEELPEDTSEDEPADVEAPETEADVVEEEAPEELAPAEIEEPASDEPSGEKKGFFARWFDDSEDEESAASAEEEPETEAEPEEESEAEPESEGEPEDEAEPEAEAELEPDVEPELESEAEPEPEGDAEDDEEAESEGDAEDDEEAESEGDAEEEAEEAPAEEQAEEEAEPEQPKKRSFWQRLWS